MKSHALTSILAVLALAAAPSRATAQTNILPASGNVGIGTTSPAALLHVYNSATANASGQEVARFTAATSSGTLGSGPYITFVNTSSSVLGEIRSYLASGSHADLAFYAYNNGLSEVMRLAAGKVGIGTSTPGSTLDVNGNITLSGTYSLLNSSGYQSIILRRLRSYTGNSANKTFMEYYGNADGSLAVGAAYVNANIVFGTNNATGNFNYTSIGVSGGAHYFNGLGAAFAAALAVPDTTFTVDGTGHTYTVICSSNQAVYVKEDNSGEATSGQLDNIVYSPERMRIAKGGYVGIGTIAPTYPLTVNGTVRAKEVIVDTGWSDYVFAPGHRLAPLTEVEASIKADGHLPGIPSQREVAANGVSVGDMQAKLLQKVEELTLYVIAQEKRIRGLEDENRQLRGCPSIHENP